MSKETVADKGQLSRSSTKIEDGATDVKSNEGDQEPITTNQQHTNEKGQKNESHETLGGERRVVENEIVTPTSTRNDVIPGDGTRQIIAVSANKNPTAFFQLARKFLMTNEMCDLSALEGAIVSAVDAAHLLERSKLASIVRIHTSYVSVEPKRRRQVQQQKGEANLTENVKSTSKSEDVTISSSKKESSPLPHKTTATTDTEDPSQPISASESAHIADSNTSDSQQGGSKPAPKSATRNSTPSSSGSGNRELRRARILVTVKRTESYKRWLEENPIQRQAIIAGTAPVATEDVDGGGRSSTNKEDCTNLPSTSDQSATATSSKDA